MKIKQTKIGIFTKKVSITTAKTLKAKQLKWKNWSPLFKKVKNIKPNA